MGVAATHGKMVAASKHGFMAFLLVFQWSQHLLSCSIDNLDTHNENAATDCQPSPYGTNVPMANFNVPLSVCEMGADPLNLSRPCSPFEGGSFDINVDNDVNVLDDVRRLMEDIPDKDKNKLTT
jgi:hypothetical protein